MNSRWDRRPRTPLSARPAIPTRSTASSLDQVGPFAKSVRDAAIMLRELAGVDPNDSTCSARAVPDYERALTGEVKGMRIGVPKEYFVEGMQPEVEKSVRAAIKNY